jgi:hypothetical protein
MVRLASAVLLAGAAGLTAGFSPAAGQSTRGVATRDATRRHLFFGSPFQWLIGGDEPTPKMVRRKARPNRRHADGPVGEVRPVVEEPEVVVPEELRPTTLSNNVLRFPREED